MGQIGSATSGRGLTGMQVASSIRMVAATHEKCDCRCLAMDSFTVPNGSLCAQTQSPQVGLETRSPWLPKEAYTESFVHRFLIEGKKVEVSEYAPKVFCLIRAMNCVSNTKFIDEWNLPTGHHKMKLSVGRSKAFFISSKNMFFLSKTIAEGEFEVLADTLESYIQYLSTHPNSLLSRFYMLLRVCVGEKVGFILCTSDVFSNASTLREKWDIKGRMPKLGRFFYIPHLVPHTYDPNQSPLDDSNEEAEINNVLNNPQRETGCEKEVPTKHDKDLTRMFWIKKEYRDQLIKQILSDYAYLASVKLMDYSLLIGVSYNTCDYSDPSQEDADRNTRRQARANSEGIDLTQVIPCASEGHETLGSHRRQYFPSKYEKGVPSVLNKEVYYIGIIDSLTRYNTKKKLSNFFKSFLWAQETLSTIPPKVYLRRINKYTQIIFPTVC